MARPRAESSDPVAMEPALAVSVVETPMDSPAADNDRPWLDLETAPHDGTLVELDLGSHSPVYARWRITRQRVPTVRGWQLTGFWADPQTRERIHAVPLGWRMPDGYLTPGMVI